MSLSSTTDHPRHGCLKFINRLLDARKVLEIGKDSQGESSYFIRLNDVKSTKKSSTPIINEIAVEDLFFNDMGCCRRNVGSQRQKS